MELIKIHPDDNVAVALCDIKEGSSILLEGDTIDFLTEVKRGHKVALKDIKAGNPVIKYGNEIALAKEDIRKGEWVHTHNARTALSEDAKYTYEHAVFKLPKVKEHTFMGFKREDGKCGVRNEIWIIPTVGCVNSVAKQLTEENQDVVSGSVEGLYYFGHPFGCSQLGDDLAATKKVLADLVHHPNAGGVLVLSLGCENLTPDMFREAVGEVDSDRVKFLVCQDVEDEIKEGSKLLHELAAHAAKSKREELPASSLVIGMKCGGSDGLSGITANPAVGRFSDRLVALGGTTILTEVPEMFGAETILMDRCESKDVFDKTVSLINNFKDYFVAHNQVIYENPSPGNKAGGISTLEEKSLGCTQKGGSSPVTDVLDYGDTVTKPGLNLLNGPGNDMVAVTNLTACGCQIILFSTGRGTPLGAPVPTVKVATNSSIASKKSGWIDFNTGEIINGRDIDDDFFEYVKRVANGELTCSERNGYREIAIFKDGVTL